MGMGTNGNLLHQTALNCLVLFWRSKIPIEQLQNRLTQTDSKPAYTDKHMKLWMLWHAPPWVVCIHVRRVRVHTHTDFNPRIRVIL